MILPRKRYGIATFQNNKFLVESLGVAQQEKFEGGLFELLETLDIKEFEILMFVKKKPDQKLYLPRHGIEFKSPSPGQNARPYH